MSDLAGSRSTIQEEETKFRGPVSESLAQRLGANVNVLNKQVDVMRWYLQGQQGDFQWPLVFDGCRCLFRDIEIVGFGMWMYGTGVNAFPYEIGLDYYNAANGAGAQLFSARPAWTPTASPSFNCAWIYDFTTPGHVHNDYGTFSTPALNAVDLLRGGWIGCTLVKAPNFAFNLEFQLFTRVI